MPLLINMNLSESSSAYIFFKVVLSLTIDLSSKLKIKFFWYFSIKTISSSSILLITLPDTPT